ncbi:MAG: HDOD domain-containing protein [Bryobacteraceae bacterium]|jgi:HD-like signal output (HDOD) protein
MKTSALSNMPAFPPVAAKLMRVASDENAATADLVYLLRADPALSAEIIRYANSPLFNFANDIKTLEQAVPLLGVRKIRSLALAAIGRTYIRAVLMMDELRVYWRYSLACALLSEMLARFCAVPEDTAYSAGLLHDIGRLGLMVTHPSEYAMLLQTGSAKLAEGEPFDLAEYERSLFGLDRFAAGEWLAREWNLPEELCVIAGRFPERTEQSDLNLLDVVRMACRLANSVGFCVLPNPHGRSYRDVLDELPLHVAASFPSEAEDLRARLEEEVAALDQDSREGERSPEMQALLEIDQTPPEPALADFGGSGNDPNAKRSLWPVALTAAVAVVVVLVWMRLAR